MIFYDPDLVIVSFLLLIAIVAMAIVNVGSDLGGMGVLLVVVGLLFGWPFAAIGAVLLIAHAHIKRKKL